MTNNDVLKKLRVALQLRDDEIVEILSLVDFRISKGEIGNFFRKEDHPKYVECKDQILRNFLNGMVIYFRGTKENPKDPKRVLQELKDSRTDLKRFENPVKSAAAPQKKNLKKKVLGKVKFNNGKPKSKQ